MPSQAKLRKAMKLNEERSNKTFTPTFKFPDGNTDIRIFPASKQDDSDDWFVPIGQHYNVHPKFPINCPHESMWAGEDCPVCDAVAEMYQNGMDDEAKKRGVRRAFYVRAIVRNEEDKGAQVVRLPSTLFTAIGALIEQEDMYGDILHPGKKGRDIRVNKTGTGIGTRYSAIAHVKNSPALPKVDDIKAIWKDLCPINDLVEIMPNDEIEKLLKEHLGYTTSEMGDSGDSAMLEAEDDDFDLDLTGDMSDEEEDPVGDDVPFVEDDAEEDTSTVSSDDAEEEDDSWMDEDADDDLEDVAALMDGDDDGLTADLADHIEEDTKKKTRKRGKTRAKK